MKIKIFSNSRIDMPLKSYKKGRKYVKKSLSRKYVKKSQPRGYSRKSLVRLIKKVSLKPVETKDTHDILENQQLYHNVPISFGSLLRTEQGVGDTETGLYSYQKRVGDEIFARGISLKFWFANKLDRPNVMYKIIVFKYRSNTTLSNADPYQTQGTANYMIRDVNTDKFKIVKVKNFNLENNAQRIDSADQFRGAEGHRAYKLWIPINKRIKYEDNGTNPFMTDYGVSIVCYDSYGTLTTDNIASYAVNKKLYFKDP